MLVPKLRFKEFTDEWQILKLSDIAFLTSSKRIYLSDYKNFGIPFYRGKEISELKKGKKISDLLYIDEVKYEEIKNKYGIPMKNDILITAVGTLANIYRIPNNEKFYFKDGNLIWLKDIKCNSSFLEYQLEYNRKKLLDSCIGSTQKALTIVGLNKINFNIPNEKEQEKISLIIALINKKILLQEQKIEALKLYKKGTLNTLTNNIDNNNLKTLKEIGIDYSGLSGKSKEDFDTGTSNFITYMSVFKNAIDKNSFRKVNVNSNENQNSVKNKDLFFTVSSETKEEVGMCATINTDNKDLYLNSFCFGYRLNDTNSVNNNYLCYLLLSEKYRKIISDLGQGFTRVNLSKKELLNVLIPIPSIEYQLLYSNTLKTMDTRIKLESDKLEKFNELKKGLMQSMFV